MQNSKNGTEINGVVEYVSDERIWVDYTFKDKRYRIEMPRTEENIHLKKNDELEMQMFILKDLKDANEK